MTIGERIRKRRQELNLTQAELAHRMGLTSKTTICKAETTDFNPTTDRIREFAKALECTPGYLMGWDEDDVLRDKIRVVIDGKDSLVSKETFMELSFPGADGETKKKLDEYYDFFIRLASAPEETQKAVETILKSVLPKP